MTNHSLSGHSSGGQAVGRPGFGADAGQVATVAVCGAALGWIRPGSVAGSSTFNRLPHRHFYDMIPNK
jgi:hypothetical protein